MPAARTRRASASVAAQPAPGDQAIAPDVRPPSSATALSLRAPHSGTAQAPATQSIRVQPKARLDLGPAARGNGNERDLPLAADDVVLVTYENGWTQWIRADDLLRERGIQPSEITSEAPGGVPSRSGPGDTRPAAGLSWQIDPRPDSQRSGHRAPTTAERGLLKLGIRLLEVFSVDLAGKTASWIGHRFELRQLQLPADGTPGLYRVDLATGQLSTADPVAAADPAKQPWLVFLHGTASSFQGSFGKLWQPSDGGDATTSSSLRAGWTRRYGSRVLAFEHRSLTESPIANALALAKALPAEAELHLVSHSRGGLVGELLCLAQRDEATQELLSDTRLDQLFGQPALTAHAVAGPVGLAPLSEAASTEHAAAYTADRQAFADLLQELDTKRLRISRFVRVACPARGTTLASGRLDRWLSTVHGLVDKLGAMPWVGDATDFLLAVVKERTDPRTLPGLEAMMPGSALTRLLNLSGLSTRADLSVIAGDVDGGSLWGQIKLQTLDWFYAADHDLVVNTASMLGGLQRPGGVARYQCDEGSDVNHFRYFSNARSVAWLAEALGRAEGAPSAFEPIQAAQRLEPIARGRASRSGKAAPLAVVIPGTMGSELSSDDDPVWLHLRTLLMGGLGKITIDAKRVMPTGLVADFYAPLVDHLAATHRVEVMPYDWRLSVRELAQSLARQLEPWVAAQEAHGQAVHLVAHSMGGLVMRALIADTTGPGAALWARIQRLPGSRLLMLGTPNLGSHEAVRWLVGQNPSGLKLTLLDLTRSVDDVIEVVRRYPGLAELVPFDEGGSAWHELSTWQSLKTALGATWPLLDAALLKQARETRSLIQNSPIDTARMTSVAGCSAATVIGHEIAPPLQTRGLPRLRWRATAQGDGTVSWASGRLAGVTTYYAPATAHDQLCANPALFAGYAEILLRGRTDRLPTEPPVSRAGTERFWLPDQPAIDSLPDESEMRGLGFGPAAPVRAARSTPSPQTLDLGDDMPPQIVLSMKHGDLRFALYPVLVGHYVGDTIVSAEAALDRQLRGDQPIGPLSRHRDLGVYPGALGTHAVFFNERPNRKPHGAIVVGLGRVGDLSPGRLESSVRDALLANAMQQLQLATRANAAPDPVKANVTALLLGTGASSLTERESLEALLRGAVAAQQRLAATGLSRRVRIEAIEVIELYEDIAITAAHALTEVLQIPTLAEHLKWQPRVLSTGEGPRRRIQGETDPGWWQRIEIREEPRGERLRFVSITDRARAEETLATGQLKLADAFVDRACASTSAAPDLGSTLFEMLMPQRLKEAAADQRSTVLVVDEHSARFPWELLEDSSSHLGRPPAVAKGLIRQLKTQEFRAQPMHGDASTALVIGSPALPADSGYADLPGARQEARTASSCLREHGFDVRLSLDQTDVDILIGLHAKPWRVLHLAGHGEQGANPSDSGLIIGRQQVLGPGDVNQMRHVPELVFINACYLGRTQAAVEGRANPAWHRLAANLGAQFMAMGVRAVVCAGWAVDDRAAELFSQRFYRQLLRGETFGDAVLHARQATYEQFGASNNTWGAYQCYGDPAYRLVRHAASDDQRTPPDYVSPRELQVDLDNLAETVRMRPHEPPNAAAAFEGELRSMVSRLIARVPAEAAADARTDAHTNAHTAANIKPWLQGPELACALGRVFGEAGLYAEAVQWLDMALHAPTGNCPIWAAEQCANFRARAAANRWLAHQDSRTPGTARSRQKTLRQCLTEMDGAIAELKAINQRAPTEERWALIGSAYKRLAMVSEGPRRSAALKHALEAYGEAFALAGRQGAYGFCNWAVAQLLSLADEPMVKGRSDSRPNGRPNTQVTQVTRWKANKPAADDWLSRLSADAARVLQAARQLADREPSFWTQSDVAAVLQVQLLIKGREHMRQTPAQPSDDLGYAHAIQQAMDTALARGASRRQVASLREHLDFVVRITTTDERLAWPAAMLQTLRQLRSQLD